MSGVIQYLRYALRQMRKSLGFTTVAVLTLALGIGPNVAIFSIIWATFLAPLPYPNAKQLVVVWNHYKGERVPTSGDDYAQFAAQSHSFQSLSFQSWLVLHLTDADHTPNVEGGLPITPGLNSRTMLQPMLLGRDFLPDEGGAGNDHVVILSDRLWEHRYNSDQNIPGKSILIDDEPYTVVGVMQASPHESGGGVEFTVPIRLMPGVHTNQFGVVMGRLKPGVTLAQAQAELSILQKTLRGQHGGDQDPNAFSLTVEHLHNDWHANIAVRTLSLDPVLIVAPLQHAVSSAMPGAAIDHVQTMMELLDEQTSPDRFQMILFGAFAAVALLLSAVGIYGVMSFAVAQRTHEIGVRMALGARQNDVIRLIVGSGFRMALAGLGIGLTGALALGRLMRSTLYGVQAVDLFSLATVAVLLLAVALVACWVPARHCAAGDPIVALRDE